MWFSLKLHYKKIQKKTEAHRMSAPRSYFFFFTDGVYADRILICIAR